MDARNLLGGLCVAAAGAAFALSARGVPAGSAGQIGPGFVPFAVGLIAVGLGLLIAASGFRGVVPLPTVPLRPVLAIFSAVLVFGVLIRTAGLVPALAATTAVSAVGSDKSRVLTVAALSLAVAVGCWLIFVVALGLPIRAFRSPF